MSLEERERRVRVVCKGSVYGCSRETGTGMLSRLYLCMDGFTAVLDPEDKEPAQDTKAHTTST